MLTVIKMGGAKKKSLAQMDKQQQLQTAKQTKTAAKTGKAKAQEKTTSESTLKDASVDLGELAKIKAITPYSVATKYNINMSAAREMLQNLEKKKTIQQIASGRGLKIYKFIGNA